MKQKIVVILTLLVLLTACSNKRNIISGESQSNVTPNKIKILHSSQNPLFEKFFSFSDSVENYSGDNSQLIFGKQNETLARTLVKFSVLPDSSVIDTLKSAKITISGIFNSNFKLGLVTNEWTENSATWENRIDDQNWNNDGADFENLDFTYETNNDTTYINIDTEIVENWIFDKTENYGLILLENTEEGLNTINSSETNLDPIISLEYVTLTTDEENNETAVTTTFTKEASYDKFITNIQSIVGQELNKLEIANLAPTKAFIKFNINKNMFNPNFDETQYNKMTVNKAELVFKVDKDNSYSDQGSFGFYPKLVKNSEYELPMQASTDFVTLSYTVISADSVNTNEFRVNITPIVQSYTSGDYDNNGIIFESSNENKNFSKLRFFDFEESDESLRPYLEIIYTEPYLLD